MRKDDDLTNPPAASPEEFAAGMDDGPPPIAPYPDDFAPTATGRNRGGGRPRLSREAVLGALGDMRRRLRYNVFTDRHQMSIDGGDWRDLDDAALLRLWADSEAALGELPTPATWDRLVTDEANRNKYDPLVEYLKGTDWDGTPRVDRFLADYFGADDTELHRQLSRCTLIGAVRRALKPGNKHDNLLVLEGPQDLGKSTAIAALCPNDDWFSDSLELGDSAQKIIENTAGKWLVEVSELSGMRKADVNKLKASLSRTHDTARGAYGRMPRTVARRFMLIGTVNPDAGGYLIDPTGNRRFWPVECRKADVDAIRRDRDQLWAEAKVLHLEGFPNWLTGEVKNAAAAAQREREQEVPWAAALDGMLRGTEVITSEQALEKLQVPPERRDKRAIMSAAAALHEIGFKKARRNRVWVWERPIDPRRCGKCAGAGCRWCED